ncbi:hypothetical protein MAPG_00134 [Magnaporthiopsis poae ATCC 64411]|uniref:Heterokaryon incompatibility domain-containing protein n=1 Tax=Magnaporthiopsis poae (strain ATCC 64411 / 73-15) TaxID=644358 RepID=A0A0C4DK71_MAGP6|nr:hypothetical protein MAPG_00134 [Magnaporthiopsis poae ATCC 64411]
MGSGHSSSVVDEKPRPDVSDLCCQWRRAPHTLDIGTCIPIYMPISIRTGICSYERRCEACNLMMRAATACEDDVLAADVKLSFRVVGTYATVKFMGPLHGRSAVLWGIRGVRNPWSLETQRPSWLQPLRDPAAFLPTAQRWLGNCHRNHGKQCELPQDPILPTRVLDLDPSGVGLDKATTVTLYETRGKTGRYVCLSYCWGTADFAKTTPDTIEAHRRGLDPQRLPRTFQDAIYIARALKVQYLWIDALCIIQNETAMADWTTESARMAHVYQNSYLTIAAAWGESVLDGCFRDRELITQIGSVRVQKISHFPSGAALRYRHDFPLLERGWTYQERMLSPRILYFGRQELLWDCWKERTCGCRLQTYPRGGGQKTCFYNATIGPGMERYGRHDLVGNVWRSMVVQYSPLQLSFPADKLPAVSGLADLWASRMGWQYLAGLWRENLIADMCWYAPRSQTPARSTQWRAPTWSWVSVDGPVEYDRDLYTWFDPEVVAKVRELARATAAHCELAGSSPTGQVKNGWVELTCCLHPVSRRGQRIYAADSLAKWNSGARREEEILGGSRLYWYSDGRDEMDEDGEYYLIPMLSTRVFYYGLVVKPEQGSPVMSRIGMAKGTSMGKEWRVPMLTKGQTVRIV